MGKRIVLSVWALTVVLQHNLALAEDPIRIATYNINILESGNPDELAEMENTSGAFLLNLAEPLFAEDHVSFGKNTADLIKPAREFVDTTESGARERNFEHRNDDANVGDCLFDQILIPVRMKPMYVAGSARIFNMKSGVDGNSSTRASDHLPVYADFVISASPLAPTSESVVRITSCLPNPTGDDRGKEQITVANPSAQPVSLASRSVRDAADNVFQLTGDLQPQAARTFTLPAGVLPLNNDGDVLELIGPDEQVRQVFRYTRSQAKEGQLVEAG